MTAPLAIPVINCTCNRLKKGVVDRAMRGAESPSDHAPAWIELA